MKLPLSSVVSRRGVLLAGLVLAGLAACDKRKAWPPSLAAGDVVLALGDSLTQGVGAGSDQAWPVLLQQATGLDVVNAGVSGDTSAQALERLPDLLAEHQPALVIVSIGGNDFLRQVDARQTKKHIRRICEEVRRGGSQVLLVAVPQFSLLAASTGRLKNHSLYKELAEKLDVPLMVDGWSQVLSRPELRADQIHANAKGYALFARLLEDTLRKQGWLDFWELGP